MIRHATMPPLLVHYMPWYTSKPVSGSWGWHWTMNRFNPERTLPGGLREIASHYHPLIGPYDTSDPLALDCQAQLMRFSGIDGVIIDWYGIKDFWDYASIHRSTQKLIERVKKAGLKFGICYEDQSVKQMVENKALPATDTLAHGKEVLRWLEKNWFGDPAYVKVQGRPLLLVFGPQFFKLAEWPDLLSGMRPRPFLMTLNVRQEGADGAFVWPQVSGGKMMSPEEWRKRLTDFYQAKDRGDIRMGLAYPGFHDIYKEAGIRDSYGFIDAREGKTFEETLEMALAATNVPLVQIATWNDYGEGTVIEPTEEFGYRYLEALQRLQVKRRGAAAFPYTPEDLRLPVSLYRARDSRRRGGSGGTRPGAAALERMSDLLTRM